jgi:hypothetical protein
MNQRNRGNPLYMKRSFALIPVLALIALSASAQEERAVVTGTVTDPAKAAVPGANVEIASKATGFRREVKTNDAGLFLIPGLLVGVYDLKIAKEGFATEAYNAIQLVVGQTRTFNTEMQIASSSQELKIEAETPAFAQSSSTIGGVIESRQVGDLPMNGRAWTTLMALVPGAIDSGGGTQKSIRFAGRGADDNNFRFDGVDATGIANQAPNATFRLQISTESIAEFKVDTALFGADTGGTAGGQVEVISKAGSNEFHGSVFEYIRNDKLNSRSPFDPATLPPLRLNQYGGSAGGPIRKNRTFFFAAYEGLKQRVGSTLIGSVPSDSERAKILAQSPALAPIVNAYPVGNTPFSPSVSRFVSTGNVSNSEDSGLVRVDHRLSDSTNIFARYNIDQASLSSPTGALLDRSQTDAAPMNGTINISHVFSPAMFNVVQFGVNRIHSVRHTDSHFFDVAKVFNSVSVPTFTKLNQAADAVTSPTTYSVKDDFTWIRGAHSIKAGVEIKRVAYNYSQASENALVYSSPSSFEANKLDQVNLIGGIPMHGLLKTMEFGYIQDTWKVQQNLTVNYGLRYEFFSVFHEQYGRSLAFDLGSCPGFCPQGSLFTFPNTKDFEPRISLAWSPKFLGGKVVIRPGYGRYYGEGQLGDLNAPSDNFTQRSSLSSASFSNLSFPIDSFIPLAGSVAVTPRALDRNRKDPVVDQWGLQVQAALSGGFILDTGYLGYHAYHQFSRTYVNRIDPATGLRPLAAFGPIDAKAADDNSHFQGWQTSLTRRFQSGLSFSANYMWSHGINDGSTGGGEADYAQNTACRSCEVASADFDVRHTFAANAVYDLPFGKGRAYLIRTGVADFLLGGWSLTSIATARSGNPVNVTITRSAASLPDGLSLQNGATFQRPDYVSGVSVVPANQNINNWINPLAFTVPLNGTWGNAGRNLIRGPRFMQLDMGLTKNFRITERFSADFRAEAFNVTNRAQFADPSGSLGSPVTDPATGITSGIDPNFGHITTTVNNGSATGSGTPREFQFSIRVKF